MISTMLANAVSSLEGQDAKENHVAKEGFVSEDKSNIDFHALVRAAVKKTQQVSQEKEAAPTKAPVKADLKDVTKAKDSAPEEIVLSDGTRLEFDQLDAEGLQDILSDLTEQLTALLETLPEEEHVALMELTAGLEQLQQHIQEIQQLPQVLPPVELTPPPVEGVEVPIIVDDVPQTDKLILLEPALQEEGLSLKEFEALPPAEQKPILEKLLLQWKDTDESASRQALKQLAQQHKADPEAMLEKLLATVAKKQEIAGELKEIKQEQAQKVSQSIQTIETLIEKSPEKVKTVLKEVLTSLQSKQAVEKGIQRADAPMARTAQQIQLQTVLRQSTQTQETQSQGKAVSVDTLAKEPIDMTALPPKSEGSETVLPTMASSSVDEITIQSVQSNQQVVSIKPVQTPMQQMSLSATTAPQAGEPIESQAIQTTKLMVESGRKEMTIQLKPGELGHLRIKLISNAHNEVSARLITETKEARDLLESKIDQLTRALENNGLKIGKVHVVQAGSEVFESKQEQQSQTGNQQKGQQSQRQNEAMSDGTHADSQAHDADADSLTDAGASPDPGEDTSSAIPFDTDVEGEEVSIEPSASDGAVDIRI